MGLRWTQNWYKFDYQVLYKKWTMLFTLYVFNWIIDQKCFFKSYCCLQVCNTVYIVYYEVGKEIFFTVRSPQEKLSAGIFQKRAATVRYTPCRVPKMDAGFRNPKEAMWGNHAVGPLKG